MTENRDKKTCVPGIRDACTVWGLPGVAIFAISLLAAVRVGSDFGHDGLVRVATFIGCNALLWLLYALLFLMLPIGLYGCVNGRKRRHPTTAKTVGHAVEDGTGTDTPATVQPLIHTGNPDSYAVRCEQHRRQCEQEKANFLNAVLDYVNYIMSPFVNEENLTALCGEVRLWAEDSTYRPPAIKLKGKLNTTDLRHFAWNIGERLGKENGYDGTARAVFIKSMFPDVFRDTEIESIKNFKLNPKACKIPIDEPEDGSNAFHYPYG